MSFSFTKLPIPRRHCKGFPRSPLAIFQKPFNVSSLLRSFPYYSDPHKASSTGGSSRDTQIWINCTNSNQPSHKLGLPKQGAGNKQTYDLKKKKKATTKTPKNPYKMVLHQRKNYLQEGEASKFATQHFSYLRSSRVPVFSNIYTPYMNNWNNRQNYFLQLVWN